MKSNYEKLGEYIRLVDKRNSDEKYGELELRGISVTKEFITSHANLVGVSFDGYKIVENNQFAYIPDTSRRGDKIAISLNDSGSCIIVSSICSVFEIVDIEKMDPNYLMMWFMRPEFDRYARFMSNGSAREVFDWDSMCSVKMLVPDISVQRKLVHDYKVIKNRIDLLERINEKIVDLASASFKKLREEAVDWDYGKLKDIVFLKKNAISATDVGELPYLPIDIIPSRKLLIKEFKSNEEAQSSLITFDKNDILIGAMRVYFHRVAIAPCKGVTRTTCFVLKPYNEDLLYYALLLCNEENTINYANSTSQGTTMPYAVWENGLAEMPIRIPSHKDIQQFNKDMDIYFAMISSNNSEIQMLVELKKVLCL